MPPIVVREARFTRVEDPNELHQPHNVNDLNDLSLLALEARTIWGTAGSQLGADTVAVLTLAYDGRRARLDGVAEISPSTPVTTTSARSWVLDPIAARVTTDVAAPAGLRLVCSDHTDADVHPSSGWSAVDWGELRSGGLGPWVGLAAGDRVVSLAHCARLTDRAAEVGVETEPLWRGRGLAPWTVRVWTSRMPPSERILFYSAFEDNLASHRVAAAAGARPLGRLVRIATTRPTPDAAPPS